LKPRVKPQPSSGQLVRRAIVSSVKRLTDNEAGVIAGRDPEPVHRARVAVRRLRSDLRSFCPLVDRDWSAALRQELAWLGTELGAVRDLDVLTIRLRHDAALSGGIKEPSVNATLSKFRADRTLARRQLVASLRSERYRQLRKRLASAARSPRYTLAARLTAVEAIVPIVRKRWKRLRRAVQALTPRPSAAALHHVRILAKRCRYAAEAAIPAEGKSAQAFADAAGRLQDALGELNDAETACRLLRRLRRKPETVFAANAFLALESDAAARARAAWPGAWRDLNDKELRSWL
jgi:CHAD domain-containing protein